jgi:hypothetical protein
MHQNRHPTISLTIRGKADRWGKKIIYLSYAFRGSTKFLSLGFSLLPEHWSAKDRRVKAKNPNSPTYNGLLAQKMLHAEKVMLQIVSEGKTPNFDIFKFRFLENDRVQLFGLEDLTILAAKMLEQGKIKKSTCKCYVISVTTFKKAVPGTMWLTDIQPEHIKIYYDYLLGTGSHNRAAQYCKFFQVVLGHATKALRIQLDDRLFDDVADKKIVRISDKKNLTKQEYENLKNAYIDPKNSLKLNAQELNTLRAFLILSKGLRYSDLKYLHKDKLQSMEYEGQKIAYFNIPAQKTSVAGIIYFTTDEQHLLNFGPDGYLFQMAKSSSTYNISLKRLALKIIGREITSHYGRHFAGQSIIDNPNLGIDDVKMMIGVRSEKIAQVYAQREAETAIIKMLKNTAK